MGEEKIGGLLVTEIVSAAMAKEGTTEGIGAITFAAAGLNT